MQSNSVAKLLLGWSLPLVLVIFAVGGVFLGQRYRAVLESRPPSPTAPPTFQADIEAEVDAFYRRYAAVAAVLTALLGGVLWFVGRRVNHDIDQIEIRIDRMRSGEPRTDALDYPESTVAHSAISALKTTADHWSDRVRLLTRRCAEQDALLASMVESVIAVDLDGRVLSMNPAASRLLGVDPDRALQRHFGEIARNVALSRFISEALESREPIVREILLRDRDDRYYRAQGTILRDPGRKRLGTLIVLQDVTQLRKLETIRRDFVANVSHELKTPITSIKGFAETLRDGVGDPQETSHFMEIILRQANRLQHIIEDLLSLSQIEQTSDREGIEREITRLRGLLRSAIISSESAAPNSDAQLVLDCPEDLRANVNAPLLEEAVVNLVGNAIKFTNGNDQVIVRALETEGEVVIEVQDFGKGISPEHLPRLFERFYRVDKARSRKMGGTGLGLAIVKHIAIAHGGSVSVDSTPGRGSVFRIHLPAARSESDSNAQHS